MNELRLHMENETKIIVTEPDIALALAHKDEINSTSNKWASLDIKQFEHYRIVKLDIGTIHTDGTKERAIVSRYYQMLEGRVVVSVQVHG